MRYEHQQTQRVVGGGYSYTLYYKDDAFEQLNADIPKLAELRGFDPVGAKEYWALRWKVTSSTVRKLLSGSDNARAVIVHHWGRDSGNPNWNTLFIVHRNPEGVIPKNNVNYEVVGNDFVNYGSVRGYWNKDDSVITDDVGYLETIDVMAHESAPPTPSPAIQTKTNKNWYNPCDPLGSLQRQLQRYDFVRRHVRSP